MRTPSASPTGELPAALLLLLLAIPAPAHADAYEFPQTGFIGTWKPDDGSPQLTIDKGADRKYTLTGKYADWTFAGYDPARAKISFTRKPKEAEIPVEMDSVRKQAAGKLRWLLVLVVDAHTVPGQVTLSGTLYPGKVEWEKDQVTGQMVAGSEVKVTPGAETDGDGGERLKVGKMTKLRRELPKKLHLKGSEADKEKFCDILEDCRTRSRIFDELVEERNEKPRLDVTLILGRGQKEIWVDHFLGGGTNEINLDHFEVFPCKAFDGDRPAAEGGRWYFPDPAVPSWACSRCEILTHILGEAGYAADTKLETKDLSKNGYTCHKVGGCNRQMLVRGAMGIASPTSVTQTFEDSGRNGIEIQYSPACKEVLRFDAKNSLKIEYCK